MTSRHLALIMVAACLLLLGATAADWAVVDVDRTIDAGPGADVADVVVEQDERTSGAEVAGVLFAVGLVGLVVAGLVVRWPAAGLAAVPLGAVAIAQALPRIGAEGATGGPALALIAGLALVAGGGQALRLQLVDRRDPPPTDPGGSRYTVEAVRGETPTGDDEWDMAVADEPNGEPMDGTGA